MVTENVVGKWVVIGSCVVVDVIGKKEVYKQVIKVPVPLIFLLASTRQINALETNLQIKI